MKHVLRTALALGLLLFTAAANAQIITGTIWHANGNRIYDLHLPPSWSPGDTLPLVFDLHYLGADARDEDTLTNMNGIADTAGFILCHPWGASTNWNAGFEAPYHIGTDDVGFISALIDTLDLLYGVDNSRVYVAGMSQGGFMAHRLACELDNRIAAIAAVGASIADSAAYYCASARPVPVMMVQGTADSVVPWAGTPFWLGVDSLVNFWRARNGCPGAPVITNLPDLVAEGSTVATHRWTCNAGAEVLLYIVQNGGNTWPGTTDTIPNSGIINQDINTGIEAWNFFRRFRLDGSVGNSNSVVPAKGGMIIYPQPASGWMIVEIPIGKIHDVICTDLQGRKIEFQKVTTGSRVRLDVAGLSAGIYLLRVNGDWRKVVVSN